MSDHKASAGGARSRARSTDASLFFASAALVAALTAPAAAAPAAPSADALAAARRIESATADRAEISYQRATGTARFVRVPGGVPQPRGLAGSPRARAEAFVDDYAGLFGLRDARELRHRETRAEAGAAAHVVFDQQHRGLDVFGSRLVVHLDESGRVVAANGVTVPDLDVDTAPALDAASAERHALRHARADAAGRDGELSASALRLLVFRVGLSSGQAGEAHLAYEVEVKGGPRVRDLFYVDAATGKLLERIDGTHEAMSRRVYEPRYQAGDLIWSEGDPLPYGDADVDSILDATADTYSFFSNLSGATYLSYDGADHVMEAVNDIGQVIVGTCPNAFWDSTSTNFCAEVTSDDIVAHEWAHAYTEHTGGLIYAYQSGALNESFSDIFGESVDLLNGSGTDAPDVGRGERVCSGNAENSLGHELIVTSPASVAGVYVAGAAEFGAELDAAGVSGTLVLADDADSSGGGKATDGCQAFVNAASIAGNIAVVRRGGCLFVEKALNAQAAGALGMVVVNNAGDGVFTMAGDDPAITIPSILVGQTAGEAVIAELANTVVATMRSGDAAVVDTWRWLVGEDSAGFGGAIRDMWTPECLGDPGRVGDGDRYYCGTGDSGGVHSNSGVPNHGFSLLVDGGTYDGVTVDGIGATKALAIYWRALSVYHVPLTDFPDHADGLEQACQDLIGDPIRDPVTGAVSASVIDAGDCQSLADAIDAVGLRDATPCNFAPILDPDSPELCSGSMLNDIASWDFETAPGGVWSFSDEGVFDEYIPRTWQWKAGLPDGRAGKALYAADQNIGDCDPGSNDQSGAVYATTPPILLPEGSGPPRLIFDHYIASEYLYDGGNVSISVNDGPFRLIDGDDFTFNGYNQILASPGQGNTNPLASEMAFTGANKNSTRGSWGQSQVELAWYASPGDTIRVKFSFGTDGCGGLDGWYVDNVHIISCTEGLGGIDPFVCARDRVSAGTSPFEPLTDVELFTQLDGQVLAPFYDIEAPATLCSPRAYAGETIADSDTHLAGFSLAAGISLPEQALDVEVDTALGRTWVDTKGAELALVPAAASDEGPVGVPEDSLHALDTYVCYTVKKARHAPRFPKGIVADFTDALGQTVSYSIRKPSRLCVAADRDGAGIKNEGTWGHLLCYKTKRNLGSPRFAAATNIYTASDFGELQVDTTREHDVCTPATITDLASLGH